MKELNNTEFAKTLVALAEILEQRQQDGLTQIVDVDAPQMLFDAGKIICDLNIHDICIVCLTVLQDLGDPVGNQTVDSEESLTAIGQNLAQLQAALPESGFTPLMQDQLSSLLTNRIQRLEEMLGALQRYLSR